MGEIKRRRKGFEYLSYLDDEGNIVEYSIDRRIFFTYILFNNNEPIYVGATTNLKTRLMAHKKDKCFDKYLTIGPHGSELISRISEKTTITLMKKLFPNSILNKISLGSCSDFIEF